MSTSAYYPDSTVTFHLSSQLVKCTPYITTYVTLSIGSLTKKPTEKQIYSFFFSESTVTLSVPGVSQ